MKEEEIANSKYTCKKHGTHETVMHIQDTYNVWTAYCLICVGNLFSQEVGCMTRVVEPKDKGV